MPYFNFFIKIASSWFYIGYISVIPATFGTIGGVLPVLLLARTNFLFRAILTWIFIMVAIFVSHSAENIFGQKDDGRIVIDEVAGFIVASLFIKLSVLYLLTSFILFRAFDILKLYPADRLQNMHGGWGVVLDDIVAGLQTGVVLLFIRFII